MNIILLPFILYYLSADELGLWYIFASINALIALLDFGFNATITRNVVYVWSGAKGINALGVADDGNGDVAPTLFKSVLRTCKLIYLGISLAALLLMTTFGTAYIISVGGGQWITSWFVYGTGVLLNLYFGYAEAWLRGIGAVGDNYKAISFSKLTQLVFTVVLLMLGFGLLGASVGYLASCLVLRFLLMKYFRKRDAVRSVLMRATASPALSDLLALLKSMWHNAWRDGLVTLSMYLSTQANTLICSYCLGLTSTGSYGLAVQITTAIANCACVWYTTSQPRIQSMVVERRGKEIGQAFSVSMLVYYILSMVLYAAFLVVGIPLVRLIRPGMNIDVAMCTMVCLYMLLYRGTTQFASLISNYNEIPYMPAFVSTSAVSVVGSFLFAESGFGLWSLVVPPLIVLCAYNLWRWPSVALKKMELGWDEFARIGIAFLRKKISSR